MADLSAVQLAVAIGVPVIGGVVATVALTSRMRAEIDRLRFDVDRLTGNSRDESDGRHRLEASLARIEGSLNPYAPPPPAPIGRQSRHE